eukprot:9168162-Pyramimonas_sp.AAC.1
MPFLRLPHRESRELLSPDSSESLRSTISGTLPLRTGGHRGASGAQGARPSAEAMDGRCRHL